MSTSATTWLATPSESWALPSEIHARMRSACLAYKFLVTKTLRFIWRQAANLRLVISAGRRERIGLALESRQNRTAYDSYIRRE